MSKMLAVWEVTGRMATVVVAVEVPVTEKTAYEEVVPKPPKPVLVIPKSVVEAELRLLKTPKARLSPEAVREEVASTDNVA